MFQKDAVWTGKQGGFVDDDITINHDDLTEKICKQISVETEVVCRAIFLVKSKCHKVSKYILTSFIMGSPLNSNVPEGRSVLSCAVLGTQQYSMPFQVHPITTSTIRFDPPSLQARNKASHKVHAARLLSCGQLLSCSMSFRTIFGDDECGGGYGLYGCRVFSSEYQIIQAMTEYIDNSHYGNGVPAMFSSYCCPAKR